MAIEKLTDDQVRDRLAAVPGWTLDQGKLFRELKFPDFVEAFAFMTKIAILAEQQAHHPEWSNVYGTVRIHLTTHEAGGLSARDFDLATAINARVPSG